MSKLLRTADLISMPFSVWLANYIYSGVIVFGLREELLMSYTIISWFSFSVLIDYYSKPFSIIYRIIPYRVILTVLVLLTIIGPLTFFHSEMNYSSTMIILFFIIQFLIPMILTGLVILLFDGKEDPGNYSTVIAGSGKLFEEIIAEFQGHNRRIAPIPIENHSYEEILDQISRQTESYQHKGVILALPKIDKRINNRVIDLCRDRGLHCNIAIESELLTHKIASMPLASSTLDDHHIQFQPLKNPLEYSENRIAKRIFDIIIGSAMIITLSPLMLLLVILVKLTLPGSPVIFSQERTGYNQKHFNCYKFRTMKETTVTEADEVQVLKGDPRITHLGSFMRKWNLDELPQLFNVIKGEMSLVGPRPHAWRMQVHDHFQDIVPHYLFRHLVVPGMTGWAQVNGWRGPTDTHEKLIKRVEHDLWYVEHWSVQLDFKILFLTLFSPKTYKNAI
jgi:putative colanic acid biosynthesis UDP-glucose lipid carrier transferase